MQHLAIVTIVMLASLFSVFTHAAEQKYPPTPSTFSTETDMKEALLKYPRGVINKEVAFGHHSQATRKVTLPNGNEGWFYQVGEGFGLRTYTLEFSDKGDVTDVLYNEKGSTQRVDGAATAGPGEESVWTGCRDASTTEAPSRGTPLSKMTNSARLSRG